MKVRKVDWNNDFDYNSVGPLCDPFHLTRRDRARHRYFLGMMIDAGNLEIAHKILAAYPYLRDEFGERMARAVREKARDWDLCIDG